VGPLDDDGLLNKARPITARGEVRIERAAMEARHDGQVKAALESGPCAFIILGGSHDLSPSVRRLGSGTTEYLRVTTARFKQPAERKSP
jgi:hypothetical protein